MYIHRSQAQELKLAKQCNFPSLVDDDQKLTLTVIRLSASSLIVLLSKMKLERLGWLCVRFLYSESFLSEPSVNLFSPCSFQVRIHCTNRRQSNGNPEVSKHKRTTCRVRLMVSECTSRVGPSHKQDNRTACNIRVSK